MGLATPIAIMAGTNAAAKRGFIIRDGIALERAGKITAIVFDKTGTLTKGAPAVAASELMDVNATKLAAALARRSNHPLSQAIAQLDTADESSTGRAPRSARAVPKMELGHEDSKGLFSGKNLLAGFDISRTPAGAEHPAPPPDVIPLINWSEIRGSGLQAQSGGNTVRLGSIAWLAQSGVDVSRSTVFVHKWADEGATFLGVASGNILLGVFALKDELKPGAKDVVERLNKSGFKVFLVSGDNATAAASVARSIGIESTNVFAGAMPGGKSEIIQSLQKKGELVAFVGDGINDAPALESADLGIAVSRASDVAREAADIILLRNELEAVPEALQLAQETMRVIRQNLFWAFFYNCLGIPLAALGFMSPILCALSMGMSDLVVIGNALRLLRWRRK
jgi:Cu+-exporting ATPase